MGVQAWATQPPAVLGVAIGTAALLLRQAPMPPAYAAALLAKAREEYLLPIATSGHAPVSGHRFGLLEEGVVPEVDFGDNGLVAVVPGGAVIRTGAENGHVQIRLHVLDGPPQDVATGWEEIVEVSWRAAAGGASVTGPQAVEPHLRRCSRCSDSPAAASPPKTWPASGPPASASGSCQTYPRCIRNGRGAATRSAPPPKH